MLSGSLPSFVQASTDANYTLDNSSGSMVMDLNSGSLVVNADLSTATGWSNATVRVHNSAHIYFNAAQTLGDLELHNFSRAAVAIGSTATSGNLLQLSGLSIDRFSKLDLGDNSMILYYTPSQEAADNSMIFGLLASGSASGGWGEGPWTGSGIYSSAAANDPSQKTALGFADNNVLHDSSFAGVSLTDDNEILIRDTFYGDSNLDGAVADSPADDPQFQNGVNGLGTGWSFGDYNYDGITAGSADASLFAANANQSISQPQYKPSLQVQPLSFTAYQYTPWSGDVATFSDSASRSSYSVSNYTATINWGGFIEDAQITQPSAGADYFRVNAQTTGLSNGPFTIQISYAAGGPYTGAPTSAVGMITALQLPSGAIPTSDADYTLSGSPGAVSLNVTAGTIAFNTNVTNAGNYWQSLTINASGTAHLIFNSAQTLDALNLSDSALVTVSQGSSGTAGNVLQLDSLSVGTTATLDLGDNSMILSYATGNESSDASMIQSLLTSGYNNTAWNGPGIDSSAAANDASQSVSVGWMDNNVGWIDSNNTVQHDSSFANVSLSDFNQILVRYTLAGDANLDGVVDGTDLQQTSRGQSSLGTGWQYGDFNYNATAGDQADFSLVSQNSGQAIAGSQYAPAFQLSLLTVQPYWNSPYIGDVATFTDTLNHNLPVGDYTADIYWGTGDLTVAQVYSTSTPGQFRINTYSPVLTGANSIMMVTVQYAEGSGHQGEPAIATAPIYVLQLPPGVNASADAMFSVGGLPGRVGLSLTAGSLTFDTNVSQSDGNYWKNLSFYVAGSAHAYFNAPEDFSNLQMVDNATVSVSRGSGGTNGNLLNVQQLSIDPGATLDLSDNALIDWYAFGVDASSSSGATVESEAAAQMSDWLRSGYNGGAWTGPGIDSSVAAFDNTHATGLGWMDNGFDYASVGTDPSYSSFDGVNLPTKDQLLVQFTYNGDANLNGQVDSTDVGLWHAGSQGSGYKGWVYGDFNYDSYINTTDLNIWSANYGLSANMANFPRAFQPTGILINPIEGVPFSGDLATFTDLLNPSNTDPSIYQAAVDWGDGTPVTAQVTATSTPGSFRINALSPALTDPNAVMTVTLQYADMNNPSPTYQGRPAAVSEPITMTPAVTNLSATAASTSEIDLTWSLNAPNAAAIEVDQSANGTDWQTLTDSLPGSTTSYADTSGLSEATQYFYRVSAIWPAGPSAFANTADAWTLANAPSDLTKQVVNTNEIDLSWVNNSAVTVFQIERSDDGTNFYPLGTSDGTSYADTSAGDGSTYTYCIDALNGAEDPSAPSNTASGSTALAPPSGLTATAVSASEINLTWNDDSVTATGIKIERSTDGVNFSILDSDLPGDLTSYSDNGLSAGSHFYYRVISLSGTQSSDPSIRADDTTTPPSPGNAAATATSSSATLTWSVAQGATGYEVDRSVNGNWVDVADITAGSTTTFTDSGLQDNTSLSYQIIAENNAGQSSPTPVAAATTVAVPAAPSGVQAVALSPTSVELIWTNNANNEQNFRIDYSDDTFGNSWSTLTTVPAGTTYYLDSGLSPNHRRYYQVFAQNGSLWDHNTADETWATTPSLPNALLTKPTAPSGLQATQATGSISLTWTASPSPSVTYWVERQVSGGNWGVIARTGGTSYTDTPGLIGIDYGYRIVAVNALLASDACASVNAHRLLSPPSGPNGVGVYTWKNGYAATIFWTPLPPDVNHPVDRYNIYLNWGQGYSATPLEVQGADAHEATIYASAANPQFWFYVTAYSNAAGESSPSLPPDYENGILTTNGTISSSKITGASVDVNNNDHINITTSGSDTINNVAYSDDDGTDFLGIQGATNLSINPGATIWICNALGDRSDLTAVTGPALSVVTPTADPGTAAYGGSLTWGGVVSGASVQLEYKLNGIGGWTQTLANGGNWLQGSATLSGPDAEEGGSYTYRMRQIDKGATIPIPGYSDWSAEVPMGVAPFAPSQSTLISTPISPTSAQLLWPEASEGETDELIQWSTNNFTTIAGSATVAPDTTRYVMTSLTPNTNYSVRLAEQKSGAPDSFLATGGVSTPAIESVSISALQGASELGPDNHPQDGWFELTRTGLPTDSVTVSVDLSGTAGLGTQYSTGAGSASPVQISFPAGVTAALLEVDPLLDGLNDPPSTTVTAAVEAQAGITIAGGPATLSINELPTLGNVTVTGSTTGSATAADANPVDLYLAQPPNGSEKITISGPPANSHILWSIAGSNNSSNGMIPNFGLGNPTVAVNPWLTNYDFKATVGIDRNGNGVLDAAEIQRTINVHVYVPALARVDANGDGAISFSSSPNLSDATSASNPYQFWINNDSDKVVTSPDGNQDELDVFPDNSANWSPDSNNTTIPNARDLEDYARVEVQPPTGFSPAAGSGWSVSVIMQIAPPFTDFPAVKLFAVNSAGTNYVTDPAAANALVGEHTLAEANTTGFTPLPVDPADFQAANGTLRYIFDGVAQGKGTLLFQFSHNGAVVCQAPVDLNLQPVEKMFEDWTVGDTTTYGDLRKRAIPPIASTAALTSDSGQYTSSSVQKKQYILFVHGWRMTTEARRNFADTAFKRLYWQGYRGRFGMFNWPTEWVDTSSKAAVLADSENFDRSEQKAWNSATALRDLLKRLDSQYGAQNVNMFAHSMGNIVASEALRLEATSPNPEKLVHTYVASQAAAPADAYDPSKAIPFSHDKFSNFTPGAAQPQYFATINNAANYVVNFFNPVDYATNSMLTWPLNESNKPDKGYNLIPGDGGPVLTVHSSITNRDLDFSIPIQRYEAFAFGISPQSKALGASASVGGPFDTLAQIDLSNIRALASTAPKDADFNSNQWDHSAEFNGTNMLRKYYWNMLMKAFGLTPWDPTQTNYQVLK